MVVEIFRISALPGTSVRLQSVTLYILFGISSVNVAVIAFVVP